MLLNPFADNVNLSKNLKLYKLNVDELGNTVERSEPSVKDSTPHIHYIFCEYSDELELFLSHDGASFRGFNLSLDENKQLQVTFNKKYIFHIENGYIHHGETTDFENIKNEFKMIIGCFLEIYEILKLKHQKREKEREHSKEQCYIDNIRAANAELKHLLTGDTNE